MVGGSTWNEFYSYDGLYQLASRASGSTLETESFGYDPTGNWQSYLTKQVGSTTLDQRAATTRSTKSPR